MIQNPMVRRLPGSPHSAARRINRSISRPPRGIGRRRSTSACAGLIVCGSLGENQCLQPDEKRAVVKHAVEVAAGRVPVISGVAEMNTRNAISYMQDCEKLGASGFMIMPPMVYKSDSHVRRSNGFAHSPKPRRCPGCSTIIQWATTPT
jgi:hypothetical protein